MSTRDTFKMLIKDKSFCISLTANRSRLLTWYAGELRVGVLRSTASEEVPQTGFESPRPLWVAVVHG